MLSNKHASLAVKILSLLLVAAISFFFATSWISDTAFVKESLESVEESNQTVMAFSAATLSASLAITALPDDFATPLADSLADMNVYFIAILVVLLLEKILIIYGIKLTFAFLMLMLHREAPTNKTMTASPAAIPYSRGKIAEQAAAVKGKMNGAYCAAL